MTAEDIKGILSAMDDIDLYQIGIFIIDEMEQRTMAYRLRLAGQGEEAGLSF